MLFFAAAAGSARPNAQICKHRTVDNSRLRHSPLRKFIIFASILQTLIESLLHPGLAPMARLKQISLQLSNDNKLQDSRSAGGIEIQYHAVANLWRHSGSSFSRRANVKRERVNAIGKFVGKRCID